MYLRLCYVIPANSSRNVFAANNVFDILCENINIQDKNADENCSFMMLGDFSSRIGILPSFVSQDNDVLRFYGLLPDDYYVDKIIPRKSLDVHTNTNGYLLLDLKKKTGLRVANGRVCEDGKIGAFTFVGHHDSSVVDYCITNSYVLSHFKSFKVHEPNLLSAHCLTEFSFVGRVEEMVK